MPTNRINVVKNSPNTRFILQADILSTSVSLRRTTVRCYLLAYNGPSGDGSSNFAGSGVQRGSIDGDGTFGSHSGHPFLPGGYAHDALRWSDGPFDAVLQHDVNGYWQGGTNAVLRMALEYGSIDVDHTANLTIPRIAVVPAKPSSVTVSAVTTTGFRTSWVRGAANGGAIDQDQIQIATDAGFTDIVVDEVGEASPYDATTLAPGSLAYIRVRSHNAAGWGPWSTTVSQSTLPAVAPSMMVTPSLNGQSASVALSPPGGASGLSKYTVEYRITGTGTTIDDPESPTSPIVVGGLTPGESYDWRASAWFGTYQSPWTPWTPVLQPAPNTNPGGYFDGSTTDRVDMQFQWDSTVNNSISLGLAAGVLGWSEFEDGNVASGGTGAIYRVTGGFAGDFAARVVFFTDCTTDGFESGLAQDGGFPVEALATYVASVYLQMPRAQRMQVGVALYDEADVYYTTVWGDETALGASEDWVRLNLPFIPPTGGTAVPLVRDVPGTGWSLWVGGDSYLMDAAMGSLGVLYPYFDGDTASVGDYEFGWEEYPNESPSYRLVNPAATPDPLADPDCPPLPTPPRPPTVPSECIDDVGQWRRYLNAVPASEVGLWSATIPTLTLTTNAEAERQVRIRTYPNPDGLAPEEIDTSAWEDELILSYIPPATEIVLDGVTERVRASVAGAAPRPAGRLLYGTGGVPATWPVFRCGIGYVVTFDVPLEAPSGNLETVVTLTPRY